HEGLQAVDTLTVPRSQQLISLRGNLAELESAISTLAKDESIWLEVLVSSDDYLSDLQSRIEELTKDTQIEVLRIRRERGNAASTWQADSKETLAELSPADVFAQRIASEEIEAALLIELEKRYAQTVTMLQEGKA
ncbi:MAG: exonuclease SbcCD subunit D C-terminal domain-containing protein, partial [Burkholderiales bacterium]|nr:exonuclease SbcCD subunit D C-terminal domain-containing protein [Burkholderiales bacterium]